MSEKRIECVHCGAGHHVRRCDCCGAIINRSTVSSRDDHDFELWAMAVNAPADDPGGPVPERFDACSVSCCTALINASGERFVGASAAHPMHGGFGSGRTHDEPTSPKDPIVRKAG